MAVSHGRDNGLRRPGHRRRHADAGSERAAERGRRSRPRRRQARCTRTAAPTAHAVPRNWTRRGLRPRQRRHQQVDAASARHQHRHHRLLEHHRHARRHAVHDARARSCSATPPRSGCRSGRPRAPTAARSRSSWRPWSASRARPSRPAPSRSCRIPAPSSTGELYPTAMSGCLFRTFWDTETNLPKIDPNTGAPYEFLIGSSYHYGGCESGQWTSFKLGTQSADDMKDLIENGNPETLSIGDTVFIQDGTETSGYVESIKDGLIGQDILVPVAEGARGRDLGGHRRLRRVPHRRHQGWLEQVHPGPLHRRPRRPARGTGRAELGGTDTTHISPIAGSPQRSRRTDATTRRAGCCVSRPSAFLPPVASVPRQSPRPPHDLVACRGLSRTSHRGITLESSPSRVRPVRDTTQHCGGGATRLHPIENPVFDAHPHTQGG